MISALKLWMRLAESQKTFRVNLDSTSTRRVWVYRRGKRTKSWAVCSSLLFSSLSFSSQVIVDNYNKSYNAVHLSHTQTLPSLPSLPLPPSYTLTPGWQQARHPLGFSLYHVERCLPAGRQMKGRWRGKRGGGGWKEESGAVVEPCREGSVGSTEKRSFKNVNMP